MKHFQFGAVTTGSDPASSSGSPRRAGVKLACAGALTAAALLAAGCGSSSTAAGVSGQEVAAVSVRTPDAAKHPVQTELAVQTAGATSEGRVASSIHHRRIKPIERPAPPKITTTHTVQRPFKGTGGNVANDDNPTGRASRADSGRKPSTSGVPNPCTLVSQRQAQSITGRAVSVTEAPLGPTCIYQENGVKASVTLSVQRLRFSSLKPSIKHLSKYTIRGNAAYCGVYGSPNLYVPLGNNRLLNVTAPCAVARKFAADALGRLGH
jgi:hypothetical protein